MCRHSPKLTSSYDVATKTCFEPVFERVYKALDNSNNMPHRVDLQELALVYILLAFGALHNLELPPNDPSAEEYLALSKSALAKGDFLTKNTLAGLQTLHVMAHFHLSVTNTCAPTNASETERGRNGDSAWPLWGLAMRICQAVGQSMGWGAYYRWACIVMEHAGTFH